MKKLILFVCIAFAIWSNCRHETAVGPQGRPIELAVNWVGSVEVGLRLKKLGVTEPLRLSVQRDTTQVFSGTVTVAETTLVDTGLLPMQTYHYQALLSGDKEVSKVLTVTTMDTTSHEFSWEMIELGNFGGFFKDVAAISENDVWAVGFLPVQPMSTVDANNAAHWDGQSWTLHRILFPTFCGSSGQTGAPAEAVFAFSSDDVWFTNGGTFVQWDGSRFNRICMERGFLRGGILKLWGTSSENIFGVGHSGEIIQFDGTEWKRMESGTNIDLWDIWGLSADNIWAVGHCGFLRFCEDHNGEGVLLHYDGARWQTKASTTIPIEPPPPNMLTGALKAVWSSQQTLYVPAGSGIYRESLRFGTGRLEPWQQIAIPVGFTFGMHGLADNDVVVVGDAGSILHWNGASWRHYPFFDASLPQTVWSVSMATNGEVFAVGTRDGKAIIYHGRR